MTDKEKAEEYLKTYHSHIMSGTMKSIYKRIYLDGLAEGRKGQEKKDKGFCEAICMKGGKIAELEKENEQLKEQIEKLKCCGNCKIEVKDEEYPCCECDGKNKWEKEE